LNQKRIGIMGGTFDPIHITHLHMAEVVKEECSLDEVWFMPARTPPHKQRSEISSEEDRITMVKEAIRSVPYFQLLLIEFEREGPSYTVDTMKLLKERHPAFIFHFIIGADMVEYLPKWDRIEELTKLVTFIGVGRPEWEVNQDHAYSSHVTKVEMIPSYISSTSIRRRKKDGKSIRFLVPEDVYRYIEEKHLYE
jgi:nicotinate-nucleotide adenylyltransferase